MAERKVVSGGTDEGMDLEQSDIELRNPSVVLSVRLDGATAKALHQLAVHRGERVSEVLREAVLACVRTGLIREEPNYRMQYLGTEFSVGRTAWSKGRGTGESMGPEEAWETVGAGTR